MKKVIYTNEPELKLKVSFNEDCDTFQFTDMDKFHKSLDSEFSSLEVPMYELEVLMNALLKAIAYRNENFGELPFGTENTSEQSEQ